MFLCKCSPKIRIFSSRIFLAKIQNLALKLHTQSATITSLLKNDKFVSNLLFKKQNLVNSLILPPKNTGLKAWSHCVRKAHRITFIDKICIYKYVSWSIINLADTVSYLNPNENFPKLLE